MQRAQLQQWERWGLIVNALLVLLGLSTVLAVWLLTVRERRARAEAEAALALRDRVLRIVSHDLKNPLHTIGMAAQLMLDAPELGEEMRVKQLAIIRRTGERANRLVIDLLDAARLQAGKGIHVEPVPTSVNSMLAEVIESFRAQAETKQQQLECHAPTGRMRVVADRDRIMQVLANMVGNAVKFTPNGGRIVVRADELNGAEAKFSVADTGPGIPPDNLAHLFDPFWQARETASLGSGLGLGIAKGIVEGHGSRLHVESHVGEGTMFSFTLPLANHNT